MPVVPTQQFLNQGFEIADTGLATVAGLAPTGGKRGRR